MSISPIQLLICGKAADVLDDERDEKTNVLIGLGRLVDSYYNFSLEFKQKIETPQASYFLPLTLRSLMETATIAMLTRIDPLRVIHSSMAQDNENYIKSRQQSSALKWKGDIMIDEAPKHDAVKDGNKKAIWDPNTNAQKLPRALLSEQACDALWTPAIKNSIKWLNNNPIGNSPWLRELQKIEPEDFQRTETGIGNRLYSELSKGIHPEFAVRREVEFDANTLATSMEDSIKWISSLAFVSHFSPGMSVGIPFEQALENFQLIEGEFNGQ